MKKQVPGIFLLVDMDRLKQVNDELGHKEGDKAIKEMATILKGYFRQKDIIGRIGGDEFVVYLPGAAKNKEIIAKTKFRRFLILLYFFIEITSLSIKL